MKKNKILLFVFHNILFIGYYHKKLKKKMKQYFFKYPKIEVTVSAALSLYLYYR